MSDIVRPATLRSPWLVVFWIAAVLCALLTLEGVADAGEESFDAVLRLVVVFPATLLIVRLPFVRDTVTPRAMVNHGLFQEPDRELVRS